jgi:hypothetical protein
MGLLQRTPRGRAATKATYAYLKLPWDPQKHGKIAPDTEPPLFGE